MSTLEHFWSPALLRAAGFALMHSLWQGAALALVVALLLRALRRHSALVRYRLAALALAMLVGLAMVTFGYYFRSAPLPIGSGLPLAGPSAATASLVATTPLLPARPANGWGPLLAGAGRCLEQHLPVVVGLWVLGVSIMALRLLVAFAYVQRLRRRRLSVVPVAWQQCLERLSRRAGLVRPVQLLVSGLVPSPLVIGYFKPLILLPLGLLSGLAPAALEMLLAHELAHIVRRDYLFNFVQAVAETIFFYHPAVWFLSAVLHTEREICCDDLATQLGGNPRQLAHALAALAEWAHLAGPAPRLALAAVGPVGALLHRVRRLARPRPAKATGFWPAGGALLGVGLLLGSLPFAAHTARPPRAHTTETRTRRSSTNKNRPDNAPRTGRPPLAPSDDALQALFQAQLLADGLLPDADHYALTLTATQLLVNGRPQPVALTPGYQRLYEAATGYRMTATTSYHTENEVTYRRAISTAPATPPKDAVVYEVEFIAPARAGVPAAPTATAGLTAEQARLLRQLQQDGLVAANARQFRVEVTAAGDFLVNGQPQPTRRLATYRSLLPVAVAGPGPAGPRPRP